MELVDLPMNILIQIFDSLDELDRCRLAKTHSVLKRAFICHAENRYDKMYLSNLFMSYLSDILPVCGGLVKCVDNLDHNLDAIIVSLVKQYCTNLKSICLRINEKNCAKAKMFIGNLKSLNSVEIVVTCVATRKIFRMIKSIENLKSLDFLHYFGHEGHEICKLVNLENLTLVAHPKTPRVDVFELCSPLKKLRCLSLVGFRVCHPNEGPQNIALEELKIGSGCSVDAKWTRFPHLKTIIARFSGYTLTPGREEWILKHSESLEKLVLSSGITRKQFAKILGSCKNLRYFEIELFSMIIDINFVIEILNILKENGFTQNKPFKMYLYDQTNQFKELLVDIPDSKIISFPSSKEICGFSNTFCS